MKKVMTIVLTMLMTISLLAGCDMISESGRGNEKSSTGITSLEFATLKEAIELDVGKTKTGHFLVKGNDDFSVEDDLEFISADPRIATFEYDKTALTTYVYFTITAVAPGETKVYAQTKDGVVKTEEISVTVAGDPQNAGATDANIIKTHIESTIDLENYQLDVFESREGFYKVDIILNISGETLDDAKSAVLKYHDSISKNDYPIEQYSYEVYGNGNVIASFTTEPDSDEFQIMHNGKVETYKT